MKNKIMIGIISAILVVVFITIPASIVFVHQDDIVVQLEDNPTRVEELIEAHSQETSIPKLECLQLQGKEKRYPNNPAPQVECESDQFGFFFWQRRTDTGWETFYYNQYPVYLTGFLFTTNPKLIRVIFRSLDDAEVSLEVSITSDYRECLDETACYRV